MLSQVQDFEDGEKLYRLSLSDVDEMTPEIKEMWEKSTITYPRIYKSDQCWRLAPPTSEGLFLKTEDLIDARKLAEKNGTQNDYQAYCPPFANGLHDPSLDPRKAIFQLYNPRKENPIAICGYRLPGVEDSDFKTPEALTELVEPFSEENLQVLLTPKFWITDLHIGKRFKIYI
jgi:hypothetical protein